MSTEQIRVISIERLEKGKRRVSFENGLTCIMYVSEIRNLCLEEDDYISLEIYEKIFKEIIGKRVKKRALFLLEKMDRTEYQLREKLKASDYPTCCIDDAISYVKNYHYLDDERYAETYTRYKKEKMSRQQIKQKLIMKGISKDTISDVIEKEYDVDETIQIQSILEKKRYSSEDCNDKEFRRLYNYLLRRGFRSNDILKEMKYTGTDW